MIGDYYLRVVIIKEESFPVEGPFFFLARRVHGLAEGWFRLFLFWKLGLLLLREDRFHRQACSWRWPLPRLRGVSRDFLFGWGRAFFALICVKSSQIRFEGCTIDVLFLWEGFLPLGRLDVEYFIGEEV